MSAFDAPTLRPTSRTVLHLPDTAATEAAGAALAPLLAPGDVVALYGDLGAGRRRSRAGSWPRSAWRARRRAHFRDRAALCAAEVRIAVAHIDLYRIERPDEIEELGLDDLKADGVLLIEWPERLGPGLWRDALRLTLTPSPDGGRRLTWEPTPAWETRWPPPPAR